MSRPEFLYMIYRYLSIMDVFSFFSFRLKEDSIMLHHYPICLSDIWLNKNLLINGFYNVNAILKCNLERKASGEKS